MTLFVSLFSNQIFAKEVNNMKVKIGKNVLIVELFNNPTTTELKKKSSKGSIKLNMKDYNNIEKYGKFDESLPTNDEQITANAGDVMLYNGVSFAIYYNKSNLPFTRIGKITNVNEEELRKILGKGDIEVLLYLD